VTRYCRTCGEPIPDHGRESLPPVLRAAISKESRSLADANAKIAAAERSCPVTRVGKNFRPSRRVKTKAAPAVLEHAGA
jgi:hypothetical protein